MKALWYMPFAFAAGAEGFALFAPYLLAVLAAIHFAGTYRRWRAALATRFRLAPGPLLDDALPDAQPAL